MKERHLLLSTLVLHFDILDISLTNLHE